MLGTPLRLLGTALLLVSVVGVTACGDDDDPTVPPPVGGDAGDGGADNVSGRPGTGGRNPTGGTGMGGAGGDGGPIGMGGDDDPGNPGDPGVSTIVTPPLRTTERGGEASFQVVLDAAPTANVTIPITSSDETEGTAVPASLTFTPTNWAAPQTVMITGVDDDDQDGDVSYSIELGEITSTDTNYDGLDPRDVNVTNTDDETAGVTVNAPANLTTTEAGGEGTFTVVLNAPPVDDVTITVTSSDTGEGTVAPGSLVFTNDNWNAPQTVTVSGVDDDEKDGDQEYTIVLGAANSNDPAYDALDPSDVDATNQDNETPGITLQHLPDLTTTEEGGQALIGIVLNAPPTSPVTVPIVSSDTTEGTVSPASVVFNANNWNAPQLITVTGVDDEEVDGNQAYELSAGPATSDDGDYDGMDGGSAPITNIDDETPGIRFTGLSSLTTNEGGAQRTFTARLNAPPTGNVSFTVTSGDLTEGTVSPAQLSFTPDDWNAPKSVTVTGVNDDVDDGNQVYEIVTGAMTSTDPGYDGLEVLDPLVTNVDNDTAGITVSPTTGLVTTEIGGTDTFSIVLNSEPLANVTIDVSSSDETEGTVTPGSVTFTPMNWDSPQVITVQGEDDDIDDGNQVFSIEVEAATSTDPGYSGMDGQDVGVSNTDDETAGITVTPDDGLSTTEVGGTDTFTIVLNSEPLADVVIDLQSDDEGEGTIDIDQVTFTPMNWDAPQTITITGEDDDLDDGNQVFNIELLAATSTDPGYNGMDGQDAEVTNTDDETAGITVDPLSITTTEAGGDDTFTIVLNSEPTADVTIDIVSSDTDEGDVDISQVTFTPLNWDAPQTITVSGEDDDIDDGNAPYTIQIQAAVSADPGYDTMDATDVSVTNTDDETAGITVTPTAGLTTTEVGGDDTFTIVLNSEPTANVIIDLVSSDPAEGDIDIAQVTFTPVNWDSPQTITVTGDDDDLDDGDQPYTIVTLAASSTDLSYDTMNADDVSVTNTDDETAGITVTPTAGLDTTEAGGSDTYTIVLNSEPTDDVFIDVVSDDVGEGDVDLPQVTFTPLNWNIPQTITVTGEDDDLDDGDQPYTVFNFPAVSADLDYDGINPDNVTVTNDDDETAGVTFNVTSGIITDENESLMPTITVVLDSEPTADVDVVLSADDPDEAVVVGGNTFTFTTANWDTPQFITFTGVEDLGASDGNAPWSFTTSVNSTDLTYDVIDPTDITGINLDNDP